MKLVMEERLQVSLGSDNAGVFGVDCSDQQLGASAMNHRNLHYHFACYHYYTEVTFGFHWISSNTLSTDLGNTGCSNCQHDVSISEFSIVAQHTAIKIQFIPQQ